MFKKYRSIRVPYKKQGLIYFLCVNIKEMPPDVRNAALNLCAELGGEDSKALYEFITNESRNACGVSQKYFVNEKRLHRLRKEFYEEWHKRKLPVNAWDNGRG